MRICRRLFVVPLGNNDHGKTTAINALVSQGRGASSAGRKGKHRLVSPTGREIDAYIFPRSYQETEKHAHHSVDAALAANDSSWRERELIIFPSQRGGSEYAADVGKMIDAAHTGGFDAICASFIITGDRGDDRASFADIWRKNWDERWTVPNPRTENWREQVEALGRDLWAWICCAIAP